MDTISKTKQNFKKLYCFSIIWFLLLTSCFENIIDKITNPEKLKDNENILGI
jgi:hypothetical protein